MSILDPDCVRAWRAEIGAARDRIRQLDLLGALNDDERAERERLEVAVRRNVVKFLIETGRA